MTMKLKYSKWIAFILICMSLTASYFIYKAVKHYQFKKEEAEHYAYRKNCGNPPNIDIVANKDAYMDKTRLYLFQQILNNVVPLPRKNKSGRMSYFVPYFRAIYLSPLSAKDYKEFITLIESMDIHKTLKENFKIVAGVVYEDSKVRYFIGNKDVTREVFIEFFKKNLRKFSVLHDTDPIDPIDPIKFIPLQDGFITFEEKADADSKPYPPAKYLIHYLQFPFFRYCCDIDASKRHANYMHTKRASEVVYTSKDITNVAEAMKQDINLVRKTSDPELIGRIGQAHTIDYVLAFKSTPVPSAGQYGHQYSETVDTCHIVDLK